MASNGQPLPAPRCAALLSRTACWQWGPTVPDRGKRYHPGGGGHQGLSCPQRNRGSRSGGSARGPRRKRERSDLYALLGVITPQALDVLQERPLVGHQHLAVEETSALLPLDPGKGPVPRITARRCRCAVLRVALIVIGLFFPYLQHRLWQGQVVATPSGEADAPAELTAQPLRVPGTRATAAPARSRRHWQRHGWRRWLWEPLQQGRWRHQLLLLRLLRLRPRRRCRGLTGPGTAATATAAPRAAARRTAASLRVLRLCPR
mmetsp:Transcript_67137/g.185957  ORF Transcript_67137/g.185957 Transcript_67137/m.185957 type:complete len:262 (-) Transcript_67137:822-1607(-)